MRLGTKVIECFKALSAGTGLPCRNLIDLQLRDGARSGKELVLPRRYSRARTKTK